MTDVLKTWLPGVAACALLVGILRQLCPPGAVRQIARGRRVLDCFTHTGAFGLNAAAGGAAHVTSVDVSADALAQARKNAARNGLDGQIDFVCADVFDLLTDMAAKGGKCDSAGGCHGGEHSRGPGGIY